MKLSTFSKALKLTSLSLAYLLSTSVYAENIIHLENGVNLLAVNGEEISSNSFFDGKTKFKAPNGTTQLLMSYTVELQNGSETELEHSNSSVVLFKASNENLFISAPKITKQKHLEAFNKKINWNIKKQDGTTLNFKSAILKTSGFQLSRNYESELAAFNQSNSPAALRLKIDPPNNYKTAINKVQPNSNSSNTQNHNKNMALEMLIYWYNQADARTRKSFKELINNQ